MSDATLDAIHQAIAEHIADEADESLLLTDWHLTAAAAIPSNPARTMYISTGTNSPYHHRLGLLHRGLEMLEESDEG